MIIEKNVWELIRKVLRKLFWNDNKKERVIFFVVFVYISIWFGKNKEILL